MANLLRRTTPAATTPSRAIDPFEMMRALMGWDPLAELGASGSRELAFVPQFEVKETKDAYVFKADLPGLREEDVDIQLTANRLTVSGKREEEHRDEDERFYAYERSYGSFSRSFTLPEGIDVEHAQAELTNGVLTLSIAKKPEVQPKRIEVKKLRPGDKAHA